MSSTTSAEMLFFLLLLSAEAVRLKRSGTDKVSLVVMMLRDTDASYVTLSTGMFLGNAIATSVVSKWERELGTNFGACACDPLSPLEYSYLFQDAPRVIGKFPTRTFISEQLMR